MARFSPPEPPGVCGTDGVGRLDDRQPWAAELDHLTMRWRNAQLCPGAFTFPVPASVNDETAAALPNPGVSAWLALTFRAKLAPGENVLILGATGVTGKLAIQIARLLGASRDVAAGLNREVLSTLHTLGVDRTIHLDAPGNDFVEAFVREAGESGFQVVIDYVGGRPVEALLSALTRKEFAVIKSETRLVQVGESAGPTVSLPAAALRSTAQRSGQRFARGYGARCKRGTSCGYPAYSARGH